MLILVYDDGHTFASRNRDRNDLFRESATLDGSRCALLAAIGKRVLVLSRDTELLSNVLGSFRHGVHTVLGFHQGIHEAPADGGVFHLHAAGESSIGLRHDKRRA